MNLPHPWTDGYTVAVAWHMLSNYRFSWNRLEEFDADLSIEEIDGLLAEIRKAGISVGPETPPRLDGGKTVAAQVARLFPLIERARQAVRQAFTGLEALPDEIWATCPFPRMYLTLPPPGLAPPEEVELVHLGDLPPRTREWQQRARLTTYPNLSAVTLFNMQLGRHGLGIDLSRLRRLQCLDLRDNGFETIPEEVLRCASLRWLDLSGNPLGALPDLTPLPELEFLALRQTRVPQQAIDGLRRYRPSLTVEAQG